MGGWVGGWVGGRWVKAIAILAQGVKTERQPRPQSKRNIPNTSGNAVSVLNLERLGSLPETPDGGAKKCVNFTAQLCNAAALCTWVGRSLQ